MSTISISDVSSPSTPIRTPGRQNAAASALYGENTAPQRQIHDESIEVDGGSATFDVDVFETIQFGGLGGLSHEPLIDQRPGGLVGPRPGENTSLGCRSLHLLSSGVTSAIDLRACHSTYLQRQSSSWKGSFELSPSKRAELVQAIDQVFLVYCSRPLTPGIPRITKLIKFYTGTSGVKSSHTIVLGT